jgi:hypothetical protein
LRWPFAVNEQIISVSSNVNFLLGAGASNPAIIVAGDIEKKIQYQYDHNNAEEAERIEYDFLHKGLVLNDGLTSRMTCRQSY